MLVLTVHLTEYMCSVLRNHVVVRIGGGWDTLGNLLTKLDPCRRRQKDEMRRYMQDVEDHRKQMRHELVLHSHAGCD